MHVSSLQESHNIHNDGLIYGKMFVYYIIAKPLDIMCF